ncbi:hypothetical protein [Roseovarius sp. M141]|uniref:non-homologous end-joining DNA ligase LigD n=1 Tax=Roseovarius sp. M141 TaxID=2583806 RepID=UPI0034E96422
MPEPMPSAGFAKTFAHVLEAEEPKRFTTSMSKARRNGRIFVDWLRNERGATAISPWSARGILSQCRSRGKG